MTYSGSVPLFEKKYHKHNKSKNLGEGEKYKEKEKPFG
jgi:hypothetical protein